MNASARRIAVVGAGTAGLTTAYRLAAAGASVTVIEARAYVGGRTRTDVVDGFRIDAGIQLFGSMFAEFFRVLREVGAGDQIVRAPGRDALWRDGRVHEVVYGSVGSMLASGALPFRTKIRMGTTYLPFLMRHTNVLGISDLVRAADAGLDGESIAEWGAREIGPDFVEYLAAPLLAAYYSVTPEETGAALYHALAQGGMDVEVFALRDGAAAFCEALAAGVQRQRGELRLSTEVQRVEPGDDGVVISGEGWSDSFDAVVVAAGAPSARRLVAGAGDRVDRWLESVPYRSTVSVALLLDRPLGVNYFGLSLPRTDFRAVAAVCVEENKAAGLVPDGRGLLVIFPTPEAGSRLLDADPQAILNAVLPDLERVFPRLSSRVTRAKAYRWPEWSPVFYPGYLSHLRDFRQPAGVAGGRIVLAGDYLCAPGVEGAVISGTRAAEQLLSATRR